jgi:hypothetical protein
VQAKLRVVVLSSYNRRVVLCNVCRGRALDCVVREALPRKVAGGFRARPSPGADPSGPDRLRLECRDRGFDRLCRDPASLEVVPHEEVACTPLRKHLRSRERESRVVDGARIGQALDRLHPVCGHDPGPLEPRVELSSREIAAPERACSPIHRLVSPQLAPEPQSAGPIELDPDVEPGTQDDLGGQRAPRLPVELDLDAAA